MRAMRCANARRGAFRSDRTVRSGRRPLGPARAGWIAWIALIALGPGGAARAEDPARDASPQPVGLDALLKLPSETPTPTGEPELGGATRKEWAHRFDRARADLEAAEARLAGAQAELEKLAAGSESWQVGAPGAQAASAETGPLSFGLRQQIRRSREEIEQAERTLTELRIEANLAGVPAEWTSDAARASDPPVSPESDASAPR